MNVKTRTSGPVKGPAGAALPVSGDRGFTGLQGNPRQNGSTPLDRSQGDAYHADEKARVKTSRASLNAAPYRKGGSY